MTTKEWFSRGRRLDEHINSLLATRDRLYAQATSTTPKLTGEVVDGTRDPHKFDSLVAMEDMIDREIDRLYDIKQEILAVVLQLEDFRYRDVLMKRYVDIKSWERVAVEMNYDYYHVKGKLHGAALRAAERLITTSEHLNM